MPRSKTQSKLSVEACSKRKFQNLSWGGCDCQTAHLIDMLSRRVHLHYLWESEAGNK
jgi:hypothetical protein